MRTKKTHKRSSRKKKGHGNISMYRKRGGKKKRKGGGEEQVGRHAVDSYPSPLLGDKSEFLTEAIAGLTDLPALVAEQWKRLIFVVISRP